MPPETVSLRSALMSAYDQGFERGRPTLRLEGDELPPRPHVIDALLRQLQPVPERAELLRLAASAHALDAASGPATSEHHAKSIIDLADALAVALGDR